MRLRTVANISDDIDIVVLVLPHLANTPYLLQASQNYNLRTKSVEALSPPKNYMTYYRNVMTKLRIFEMHTYERIIYLDSDMVILENNLDELFNLPNDIQLAIPRCYWDDLGVVTSILLVIKPSDELQGRVMKYYGNDGTLQHDRMYDMDLINKEFRDDKLVLPGTYGLLNLLWKDKDIDRIPEFANLSLDDVRSMAHFVHFSGTTGKPWQHKNAESIKSKARGAHPFFWELFAIWHSGKKQHCDLRS